MSWWQFWKWGKEEEKKSGMTYVLGGGNPAQTPALGKPSATNLVSPLGGASTSVGMGMKSTVDQGIEAKPENTTSSESVESENRSAEDWLNQGNNQSGSGDFEGAINSYNKALELEPNYHEVWFNRGIVFCDQLNSYEKALDDFNKYIEIKPDLPEAWRNRGITLGYLGRNGEEIASYDRAIEIKPDYHEAWCGRGIALWNLGRYEEAIASFEKALKIKPDYYYAWFNLGIALSNLGRIEEAITPFEKALEIQPDNYYAWNRRGLVLIDLMRCEEALLSFDKALDIKPNFHEAWDGIGVALSSLGRYEEAMSVFDQALEIETNSPSIYCNLGNLLKLLGKYKEAISAFDKSLLIQPSSCGVLLNRGAIFCDQLELYEKALADFDKCLEIKPDEHPAWGNRGIVIRKFKRDYNEEIANYRQGLEFCQQDTHPEGWGCLYWWTGRAHYRRGKKNRKHLFAEAREAYDLSLKTLTVEAFPETHLEVLQDYIKLCWELGEIDNVAEIYRQGTEVLQKLITKFPQKKEYFERKFISFQQVIVDLCIQSGDVVKALVLAEQSKATCLSWMLPTPAPMDWPQIQNLVQADGGAFIYWYYSPLALHTILLLPNRAPHVETTPVDNLDQFLTTWNEQYTNYTGKDKTKETIDETWRQELPNYLTKLTEILSIKKILPLLTEHNIQNLTLIPHREYSIASPSTPSSPQSLKTRYFPTLHLQKSTPILNEGRGDRRLLSIEAPDSIDLEFGKELGSLSYAAIESAYICQAIGDPLYRIADEAATKDQVIAALTQGCEIFHFTGHAGYNFDSPKKSSLCLSKKDRLTIEDLVQIPLNNCELVCLSACETGITGKQTILDEYVGLVSAFLSQGVGTVVSTLWQVQSAASAIVMMEFYRRRQNLDDITALNETTHWLRSATAQDLINWCGTMQTEDQPRKINRFLKAEIAILSTLEETDKPYSDPYHWAAYTITGG